MASPLAALARPEPLASSSQGRPSLRSFALLLRSFPMGSFDDDLPGLWIFDLSEEEREEEESLSSLWLSHPSLTAEERSPSLLR
jgi:hypothetical protein